MDRRTKELVTMNQTLHPTADVDKLYLPQGRSRAWNGFIRGMI